jgi:hypothetical protein
MLPVLKTKAHGRTVWRDGEDLQRERRGAEP